MKKILLMLFVAAMMLVGCSRKPTGMSNDDYQLAKQIIAMTDDVFDNNSDALDVGKSIKFKADRFEDGMLDTYAICLGTDLVTYSLGSCSSKDVIEERNKLAEYINEKKR